MTTRTRLALSEPHPHMGSLISSYQDGLATPDEADLVERHLLECERCRSFYGGLQDARALIGDLPAPSVDPARLDATYAAIFRRTVGRDPLNRGKIQL
jgi:predicted anti-sigma-YlaC factor YlaD